MTTEYLKKTVGKYLCTALSEVAIRRPERPIEFLAYYLLALYEKDPDMQGSEEAAEAKTAAKSSERDLALKAAVSQMFTERLSVSKSKDLLDVSPAGTSPSTSIGIDMGEISPDEDKMELVSDVLSNVISLVDRGRAVSAYEERVVDEFPHSRRAFSTSVRKAGTVDPFLARRESRIFDENAAPIGNPAFATNGSSTQQSIPRRISSKMPFVKSSRSSSKTSQKKPSSESSTSSENPSVKPNGS